MFSRVVFLNASERSLVKLTPTAYTPGLEEVKGPLSSEEIDRLIAATPTEPLSQAHFERLGLNNWQEWLDSICSPIGHGCHDGQLLLQIGESADSPDSWRESGVCGTVSCPKAWTLLRRPSETLLVYSCAAPG